MFTYETTVRLRDTDAAGVLYFASLFSLAHEAFESFMESTGLGVETILTSTSFNLPIVHAEADYRCPLRPGAHLRIAIRLEKRGDTSFSLLYRITHPAGDEAARVRMVHVAIDRASGTKRNLPDELISALTVLAPESNNGTPK